MNGGTITASAETYDPGLGVQSLKLTSDRDQAGNPSVAVGQIDAPTDRSRTTQSVIQATCSGGKDARCPAVFNASNGATVTGDLSSRDASGDYKFADGPRTLTLTANDPINTAIHAVTIATPQIKIDHSAPSVDAPAGELVDAADAIFKGLSYELSTSARDPESGVESVRVLIDGVAVLGAVTQSGSTCDGCSLDLDQVAVPTDGLTPGNHSITVQATNYSGLSSTSAAVPLTVVDAPTRPLANHDDEDSASGDDPEPVTPEDAALVDTPVTTTCDPNATSGSDTDCSRDDASSPLDQVVRNEPSLLSDQPFAGIVADLPTTLGSGTTVRAAASPSCVTGSGTTDDLDRGACGWGISDQKAELFTDYSTQLRALSVNRVRLVVPWDLVPRGRGYFNSKTDTYPKAFPYRSADGTVLMQSHDMAASNHALASDPGTLRTATTWIQNALPCKSSVRYEVMVVFEHSRPDAGVNDSRNPQGYTLPTPDEYETAVRAFLHLFNNKRCKGTRRIRLVAPWNEPNYDAQPTYGPLTERAGVYWSILNKVCHTTYTCFVPAGEFVDYDPAAVRRTISRYTKGMNRSQSSAWSFHAYRSSHLSLGAAQDRIKKYLTYIPSGAKMWLSEQGGRYDQPAGQTPTPRDDECKLMRFREFSSRITRFWQYELVGPPVDKEKFDSALIGARDPENGVRDQYYIYKFFSAKMGTGYGDRCPENIRNYSLP